MVASSVTPLNLNEEELPQAILSVVLVGVISDSPQLSEERMAITLNAREYIDANNDRSTTFDLFHYPDETHLLPITTKVTRGATMFVTGHLTFVQNLQLIKITQISYVDLVSTKPGMYAWQNKSPASTLSTSNIAKSILQN